MPETNVSTNPLDPTPRTMEQMAQSVSGLKELLYTRMAAYDEAIKLLQEFSNRQPTPGEIYKELIALKELTETRFSERDRRFAVIHDDDRAMVKDALVAAKEATTKTEANFTEQIRAIGESIRVGSSTIEARLTDIKERIDRGEGTTTGTRQQTQDYRAIIALGFTAILVGLAVLGFLLKT